MKEGKLVPSAFLVQKIKEKMEKVGNKLIYILDGKLYFMIGYPRNK